MSVATGRPVIDEVMTAVAYSLRWRCWRRRSVLSSAACSALSRLFSQQRIDRLASVLSVVWRQRAALWLGMLLVILCSVMELRTGATGGGPIGEVGWQWDWAHLQFMLLPALTLSVIPTGIIARTVRSQVADILSQEFIVGLRARRLNESRIFVHVMKNAAPTALAVMGLGGLSDGRLDPCGDRFLGREPDCCSIPPFFSATCPAAGHHLGAGAVFRAAQPAGGYSADHLDPRIKRS